MSLVLGLKSGRRTEPKRARRVICQCWQNWRSWDSGRVMFWRSGGGVSGMVGLGGELGEALGEGLGGLLALLEVGLEAVAEGHELFDFGDDAFLFG